MWSATLITAIAMRALPIAPPPARNPFQVIVSTNTPTVTNASRSLEIPSTSAMMSSATPRMSTAIGAER